MKYLKFPWKTQRIFFSSNFSLLKDIFSLHASGFNRYNAEKGQWPGRNTLLGHILEKNNVALPAKGANPHCVMCHVTTPSSISIQKKMQVAAPMYHTLPISFLCRLLFAASRLPFHLLSSFLSRPVGPQQKIDCSKLRLFSRWQWA